MKRAIGFLGCVVSVVGAAAAAQAQPWVARHGMTSAQYQSEFNNYVGQG